MISMRCLGARIPASDQPQPAQRAPAHVKVWLKSEGGAARCAVNSDGRPSVPCAPWAEGRRKPSREVRVSRQLPILQRDAQGRPVWTGAVSSPARWLAGTSPAMTSEGAATSAGRPIASPCDPETDQVKKPGPVGGPVGHEITCGGYFACALRVAMSASLRSVMTPILLSR
jgi:hypothetical protein